MHVIQLSLRSWLVLDERVKPRFLIVRSPMVHKQTGETHVVHRVERWNHVPESRLMLAVCDGEMAAREWCKTALETEARAAARGYTRYEPGDRTPRTAPRGVAAPPVGVNGHARRRST